MPCPGPEGQLRGPLLGRLDGHGDARGSAPPTGRRSTRRPTAGGSCRKNRQEVPGGIVVWTGREMIGWGGGCCGDALSEGAAYNPATNTLRRAGSLTTRPRAAADRGPGPAATSSCSSAGTTPPTGSPAGAARPRGRLRPGHRHLAADRPAARGAHRRERRLGADAKCSSSAARERPAEASRRLRPRSDSHYNPGHDPLAAPAPPWKAGRSPGAAAVWTGKRLLIWGGTTSSPAGVKLVTPEPKGSASPRRPTAGHRFPGRPCWVGSTPPRCGQGRR